MKENEILKRYGADPVEMTMTLLEYAGLADDIPGADAHIGIKPNLVCQTPAEYGATTHPEIVEGIIRYLQEHGFSKISVIEGSWVGDSTAEAYVLCGYQTVCEKYQVPFIDTQKDSSHRRDCGGMELSVCDAVSGLDYLINVPVLKGHCQTKMTCALKNMKGLIPNSEKRRFHTIGLHQPIAHLSCGIHQDFIVIDHICGDPTFEEGGNPLKTDCVMAAKDPVLVDAYACKLLGLTADDVQYVRLAEKLGVGSAGLAKARVLVLNEKGEILKEFAADGKEPYEKNLTSKDRMFEVSVDIDECDSCSACFSSLTEALYHLKEDGLLEEQKLSKIAIGQGHRGKTGEYGIGNCCQKFTHYIPGCPPKEEEIYKVLQEWN